MDGGPQGPFGRLQLGREAGKPGRVGIGRQDRLESPEGLAPTPGLVVTLDSSQDPIDQRDGPVALEQPFGGLIMGGLAAEVGLGVSGVDREEADRAAPLECPVMVAGMRQEERAVGPQE